MGEPVVFFWESFVNAVVEVLVMREDDMTADIVELDASGKSVDIHSHGTHEAFFGHISRSQTTGNLVGVYDHP